MNTRHPARSLQGYTLIESLMVIAIMGLMATIIVTSFSNVNADSSRIIARQQQAAVQNAVNAWVNSDTNRVNVINANTGTGKLRTLAEIQAAYNALTTAVARFNLVAPYLDSGTSSYITSTTTNSSQISSDALAASKQYIGMPDWVTGSYPQVTLNATQ